MAEHYTKKNTITATAYCKKCRKFTMHRIDDGRLGPCMPCVAETAGSLEFEPAPAQVAQQVSLFGAPASTAQVKAVEAPAISRVDEAALPVGSEAGCELSRAFAQACDDARLDYRGYSMDTGRRVYAFSRRGAPRVVFQMCASDWDRTSTMLEREARRLERWIA
jgi:hypothetical protein